jgi:hypothetical protein
MGDAIVRRACSGDQGRKLGEGFDGDEDRTTRQCGTRDAIRHPHRNRGGALILLAQPDFTAMSHAPLHANSLAMQWMPRIVNGYVLSVVGRM